MCVYTHIHTHMYRWDTSPLLDVLQISSPHSVAYLSMFLLVCFDEQMFLRKS